MAVNDKDFYASHGFDFDYKNMLDEYIKGVINQAKIEVLEELKKEIEKLDFFEGEKPINITRELMDEVKSWEYGVKDCKKLIQSRIDKLKENKE